MHVDTSPSLSTGLTPSGETTEVDQLKRYLRAIRLRWPVIAALAVLGALAGWVLTPEPAKVEEGGPVPDIFYAATHTLVTEAGLDPLFVGEGGGSGLNLTQVAFLATTGEVPDRVAERLSMDPTEIASSVQVTARPDVSSLEITAYARTGDEAVLMADTMATEIGDYVVELATERYESRRDATFNRLEELDQERLALEDQITAAGESGEADVLRAELEGVLNDYRLANESFRSLAQQGPPKAGLSTIEAAQANAITEQAYTEAQSRIRLGPDYVPPSSSEQEAGGPATVPGPEKAPDPKVRAGLGGVLGMMTGLIVVLVWDRYDTRLRRRNDVEVTTGLPVLAEVPPLSRRQQSDRAVTSHASPRSPTAEAFRVIRTALLFSWGERDGQDGATSLRRSRVVMVTSASPGEGKTTTVANLASVLAEGGQSVLVVDCDFRRPAIERYLRHAGLGGTSDADSEQIAGLAAAAGSRLEETDVPGVHLITGFGTSTGDVKPVEIVESLRRVVEIARRHFDVVLLDTAPMLTTNDASDLMPEVDSVLFVVRNGSTRREKAFRACEFLRRLDAPALGIIFNAADETPATYYYYGYMESSSGRRKRRDRPEATDALTGEEPAAVV